MGLFVMGALVSKWTTIKFPTVVSSVKNDDGIMVDTTVQSILDQLLPGLAALGLTFLCMWLLNKKVNAPVDHPGHVRRRHPGPLDRLPGSLTTVSASRP